MLIFVCLSAGCASRVSVAELVGANGIKRTIARAETVRMWRVSERSALSDSGSSQKTDAKNWRSRYDPHGDGAMLDPVQREKLKALFLTAASYERGRHPKGTDFASNMCLFDPIVRVRFDYGRGSVEAWICFNCSEVAFADEFRSSDPEDIRPSVRELLTVVKSVLNDDPVIAKIPMR